MTEQKNNTHKCASRPPIWRAMKLLEEKMGHAFSRPELLEMALTHSSWANEQGGQPAHNERLEFLGDAVLELCISEELYTRFPEAREGVMTQMRSELVNENTLAAIAAKIGIDSALRLGKGEEHQDGRQKKSLLADAMEAVLAAVFLDCGFGVTRTIVRQLFCDYWSNLPQKPKNMDAKSQLQQKCQKQFGKLPEYQHLKTEGPNHEPVFTVSLKIPDGQTYSGHGGSQKKAEHDAAAKALKDWKN